jgi:hypothetical protein
LETGVPVVITHQMGRAGGERRKGARLSDIAGSYNIVGWLDVALVLMMNDTLKRTSELGVLVRKIRDFDPMSFTVKLNVNEGEPMKVVRSRWIIEDAVEGRGERLSDDELDSLQDNSLI